MKIHEIMNNKGSREETRHVGQLEENAFLEDGFNGGSFAPYVRNHRKIVAMDRGNRIHGDKYSRDRRFRDTRLSGTM